MSKITLNLIHQSQIRDIKLHEKIKTNQLEANPEKCRREIIKIIKESRR